MFRWATGCWIFVFGSWALASDPPPKPSGCPSRSTVLAEVHAELGPTPHLDALAHQPISLLTKRLHILSPARSDLRYILPMFNDFKTAKYTWFWLGESHWDLEKIREKFEGYASEQLQGRGPSFVLHLTDQDRTVIGRCAFWQRPDKGRGSWEFGITIHHPYWGQGFARETLEEVLRYAFAEMGAKEIWFRTEPENTQMLKQYSKLGIPKVIDSADDTPEAPLFHRYHHFVLTRARWLGWPTLPR